MRLKGRESGAKAGMVEVDMMSKTSKTDRTNVQSKFQIHGEALEQHSRYMSTIAHAAIRHCVPEDGIYHGEDGCHRLARECGAAYVDFEIMGLDVPRLMSKTYSGICVIAYSLKPPVDAGTWLTWLREGYEDAKKLWAKEEDADVDTTDTGGV